jgi:hypothetical protein
MYNYEPQQRRIFFGPIIVQDELRVTGGKVYILFANANSIKSPLQDHNYK